MVNCLNSLRQAVIEAVLQIRIGDPVPFILPWIRDPGWEKNPDPGSGMGKKSRSGIRDEHSGYYF
jgi:hypothetical protein